MTIGAKPGVMVHPSITVATQNHSKCLATITLGCSIIPGLALQNMAMMFVLGARCRHRYWRSRVGYTGRCPVSANKTHRFRLELQENRGNFHIFPIEIQIVFQRMNTGPRTQPHPGSTSLVRVRSSRNDRVSSVITCSCRSRGPNISDEKTPSARVRIGLAGGMRQKSMKILRDSCAIS